MPTNVDLEGTPSQTQNDRQLSFDEVLARLPLLHRIASDAIDLFRTIESTKERLNQILARRGKAPAAAVYSEEVDHIAGRTAEKQKVLDHFLGEILALGADQVDLSAGTVRFPISDDSKFLLWSIEHPEDLICLPFDEADSLQDNPPKPFIVTN